MFDWLKTLPNWLKLKPRHLLGVATVCFIIVGLPEPLRKFLGYDDLIRPYRGWISLTGLAFGVYGLVMLVAGLQPWLSQKLNELYLRKKAPKILSKLSSQEKSYLAKYIAQHVTTLDFSITDGVIRGLEGKGVVYRASSLGTLHHFAFNLQSWVSETLDENPELKNDIVNHYVHKI